MRCRESQRGWAATERELLFILQQVTRCLGAAEAAGFCHKEHAPAAEHRQHLHTPADTALWLQAASSAMLWP